MTHQFKQKGKQYQSNKGIMCTHTFCVQTACACLMTKQGIEYKLRTIRELLLHMQG